MIFGSRVLIWCTVSRPGPVFILGLYPSILPWQRLQAWRTKTGVGYMIILQYFSFPATETRSPNTLRVYKIRCHVEIIGEITAKAWAKVGLNHPELLDAR